jgi:hypothetical protein
VPAELAGVVRDSAGSPIGDAEVIIPRLSKSAHTDRNGKFALTGIIPGVAHEVMFRHIGFETVRFVWTGDEGKRVEVAVTLKRLPNTLSPTVVWANETKSLTSTSMVSGVVFDSAGVPVAGADLQLIGAARTTKSADDGTFVFRHVAPGPVTLRARRMGYVPSTLTIELGTDDQRDVSIRVHRLEQTLDTVRVTEASGYGRSDLPWREFDLRERWRSNSGPDVVIGPKRLSEAGGMPLDWLLRPHEMAAGGRAPKSFVPGNSSRNAAELAATLPDAVCILENGSRFRYLPLGLYSANEVDRLEYYPPAPPEREYTGTLERRMQGLACRKRGDGSRPAYYVVWLKDAR